MENNTFKGSIFGGFNRQDVMNYIEKSSRESAALLEENAERIRALEEELQQLRQKHGSLQAQSEETAAALAEARVSLASEQAACADLRSTLERTQAENSENAAALAQARAQIEALQREVDEYHQLKKNIAEVEVDAKHRSDALIAQANATADEIRKKAEEESAALLHDADERAKKALSDANLSAAATRQKAEQHAMLKRQQIAALLANCQSQYAAIMDSYRSSALQAATSIQKAQEAMTQLPAVFEKIGTGLNKLSETGQKKD